MGGKKRVFLVVLSLLLLGLLLRKHYMNVKRKPDNSQAATARVRNFRPLSQAYLPLAGVYDYKRMLDIITHAQDVKEAFYARFSGVHTRHKVIDIKETKILLADVYRERQRLQYYISDVKERYNGAVPTSRMQILLYYQQVLEQCSQELEKILRQA